MVRFGYTILYVQDVAQSIAFYMQAFGFEKKFISPENDYGELDTGNTSLAFISKELGNANLKNGFIESAKERKPFGIEIALITDNVGEIVSRAVAIGATLVESPAQKPWGQTVAYIRDIDGFLMEICSPIA